MIINIYLLSDEEYKLQLIKTFGSMWKLSDTFYPVGLARGFCTHNSEVGHVFIKKSKYSDRLLWHEIGHCIGYDHTLDISDIMFPWFFRGSGRMSYLQRQCKNHELRYF